MSWQQRTRLTTICVVGCAIVAVMLITLVITSFESSRRLASLSWLTFTAFPLGVVVLIAGLARIQQYINLRAPQGIDLEKSDNE